LEENQVIRQARLEHIQTLPVDRHAAALAELEEELEARVPEQLASRILPLPAVAHVWDCFWELDSERPVSNVPIGLGGSIPIRGRIPWSRVEQWADARGIVDRWDRSELRRHLNTLEAEFSDHQSKAIESASGGE
jgi:hypothetical protein